MKRKIGRLLYELAVLVLSVVLLGTLLFRIGYWLMPERTTYGSVWSSYLQEEENSVDVLVLGSSRAYCDLIPAIIYDRTGITSFLNCGPSQTASLTYYYLRESLKTQSPKYVFVEASALYYGKVEEHSKTNICYMPCSWNRILAARECEEGILELALYPLQEFHYRIYEKADELPPEKDGTMLCGYTPLDRAEPQTERTLRIPNVEPGNEKYLYNLDYFRRIAELCEQKDIACVFFLAPTMSDYTDAQTERLRSDLLALPCAGVEDWTDLIAEIGIDNNTDWLDNIHFNQTGAEKFTAFFSDYLLSLGLEPTPNADAELWKQRLDYLKP